MPLPGPPSVAGLGWETLGPGLPSSIGCKDVGYPARPWFHPSVGPESPFSLDFSEFFLGCLLFPGFIIISREDQ